jgi:hypothetical protein
MRYMRLDMETPATCAQSINTLPDPNEIYET